MADQEVGAASDAVLIETKSLTTLLALHAQAIRVTAHGAATHDRYEDVAVTTAEDSSSSASFHRNNANANTCWTPDDTSTALSDCKYETHLGLKFYHDDPLPRIEQAALSGCSGRDHGSHDDNGGAGTITRMAMFVDHEFPTHTAAVAVTVRTTITDSTGSSSNDNNNDTVRMIAPGIITSSNCRDFLNAGNLKRASRIRHFVEHAATHWVWVRGSSIPNAELFSSVHPRNLLQGKVGNCGFCSGFASLAACSPETIKAAFGDHSERCLRTCGAVSVRLFINNNMDQPRFLLLDDHVLCNKNDTDQRTSPSIRSLNGDLWARLLEKAFVKVQGSYAGLDGYYKYNSLYRHPGRALQLLTGAPLAVELHYNNNINRPTAATTDAAQNNNNNNTVVYNVLVQSQIDRCARIAHCRKRLDGLHANHGYSLLWVGETTTSATATATTITRLVCLRNPHGRGSYTGPYGFRSRLWETAEGKRIASQLIMELDCFEACPTTGKVTWTQRGGAAYYRVQPSRTTVAAADDDGIFFMEFDAFVECFPVTTVVGPMPTRMSHTSLSAATAQTSSSSSESPCDCVYQIHKEKMCHVLAIFAAAKGETFQ